MNILVIGSAVIDLFLSIKGDNHVSFQDNKLLLNLGDKIPIDITKPTLGGDGANVSVGLKRLSFDTTFFTFLGNDLFSKDIEETIKKESIKLIVEKTPSGKSPLSLILDTPKDRIIFSHREVNSHNFNYNESTIPEFIYLTSIGNEWKTAYEKALQFVKNNNLPLAFTPGTPQLETREDITFEVLKNTKLVFINKEEAKKILNWQNIDHKDDIKEMLFQMKSLGPVIVSITDGAKGAYAIDENNNYYEISPFNNETAVEKTGAGDAYTSGFLGQYLLGGKISECMRWGSINAYASMKKIGAQDGLLTFDQINKLLSENNEYQTKDLVMTNF